MLCDLFYHTTPRVSNEADPLLFKSFCSSSWTFRTSSSMLDTSRTAPKTDRKCLSSVVLPLKRTKHSCQQNSRFRYCLLPFSFDIETMRQSPLFRRWDCPEINYWMSSWCFKWTVCNITVRVHNKIPSIPSIQQQLSELTYLNLAAGSRSVGALIKRANVLHNGLIRVSHAARIPVAIVHAEGLVLHKDGAGNTETSRTHICHYLLDLFELSKCNRITQQSLALFSRSTLNNWTVIETQWTSTILCISWDLELAIILA